jgi:hypothetical protein
MLERARQLLPGSDSVVIDRALCALLEELEGERELAALTAHPYDADPELAWEALPGPDLPYDGDIPDAVIELARQRRRERA